MPRSAPAKVPAAGGRPPAAAQRFARAAAVLCACTTGLIVLGALVRAHGAGLACPDWPLCFGSVVPRFDFRVAFEWGHRALAGSISLGFVGLAAWALRDPGLRRPLAPWLALTAGLLSLQILLGALTVWQLLASWTVTAHLLCGNAVNASLALLALRAAELGRSAEGAAAPVPPWLRWLVGAAAALLLVQMTLGGLVASTFAGLACDEWPTCSAGAWFPASNRAQLVHLLHRYCGYALVMLLLAAAAGARGVPTLRRPLAAAAAIGTAQAAVGVANVLLRIPVEITGLHSLLAALLVLALTAAVHTACRPVGAAAAGRGRGPAAL